MRPKAEWAIGFVKFVLGVGRQQDLYLRLHLLKVYIFTAHFEIRKLIFGGYVMYNWIVTLAARFSFWHKIYFNFELNSVFLSDKKQITRWLEDMNFNFSCWKHHSKIKSISFPKPLYIFSYGVFT